MNYLERNREKIFKKYTKEELIKDIGNYKSGSGKLQKTLNHYFEELIFQSIGPRGQVSPYDALQDDELMQRILDYVASKPNFYTGNEITNVKSFFRNGGKWACKVANFCPKNARDIYTRYYPEETGLNILDTSAGFGARMSAALLTDNNYFGIDPNTKLMEKLNEYGTFLKENNFTKGEYKLYCQGSEKYIPELENTIDVMFTSPPYFDLEIYTNEETQSVNYGNYENWLEYFAKPTITNIGKYLKVGGYAMINIKNMTYGKKYPLFDDWKAIFESIDDFEYVETFEMQHQSKKNYTMNTTYTEEEYTGFKEPIMVFRRKGNTNERGKKIISYKGETITTSYDYEELSDKEFSELREEYYKKPTIEQVAQEMKTIAFKDGVKNTHITNYYFRDLIDKTKTSRNKWCIEDVFNHKPLLSYFWARTKMNDKVFLEGESVRRKLDTAFRIGGMGIASRVSNFPIRYVDAVLKKYNVNNIYYDYSCGWGARLTSALKNKVNYCGTDPNYLLVDKLKEYANDFQKYTGNKIYTDIRAQGSEILVPEWVGKVGVAFSSPPYFDLEDYGVGNQSYKPGTTYQEWLDKYLKPTIANIWRYLVRDGYFIINIKNLPEYRIVDDIMEYILRGFELVEQMPLERVGKPYLTNGQQFVDNEEAIYVFRKVVKNA